jgi:hypothetical protein
VIEASDELEPTIDDLVKVARAAGYETAKRRTIHQWVGEGNVARPRKTGRDWRYPVEAISQVWTVGRWRKQKLDPTMLRFALFVETGTVPGDEAVQIAGPFLEQWEEALEHERARLAEDPDALLTDAEHAAKMRSRAPLPHRVRGVSLDERALAMTYALGRMLSMPLTDKQEEQGAYQLERIVGLRSGHGGAERDLSDIALSPDDWPADPAALASGLAGLSDERIEFARRGVEFLVAWMPALSTSLLGEFGVAFTPMIDILEEWSEQLTPGVYIAMFAVFATNARKRARNEQIHESLRDFRPPLLAAAMLEDKPEHDVKTALSRLAPHQRVLLEREIAVVRADD